MTPAGPGLRTAAGTAALAAALAVAWPSPPAVHAQEAGPRAPGDAARVLGLEEAFALAERHNPRYRKARNQVRAAAADVRSAWGGFLPDLSADVGFSKSFSRRVVNEDFFGNPIENPEVETVWSSRSSQGLGLSLTLFDGGRRFHELGRTRAEETAAEVRAEAELVAVRADVEEQYREAQKQARLVEVEEGLLEARRRDLDATRRGFRTASVNRVDVLTAELEVTRQEQRLEDARSAARRSTLALASLVGAPDLGPFRVADEPPTLFDPTGIDADSLVEVALRKNPERRNLEAVVDARRAAVGAAGSERWWPSVRMSANLSQSEFARENDALFVLDPANQGGSFGLSVSFPLFQGFRTSASIRRAEVQRENAVEDLRMKELEIEEEVRGRLLALRTAHRTARIAERALEIARERLRLERERYRLGLTNFLDLQQVVSAAGEAERRALETRYAFTTARTALERVVGAPVTER